MDKLRDEFLALPISK